MKLIYGRAGSGKSEYVFKEIKNMISKNISEKIYLVTPEQFSYTAEKRLLENLEGAITQVEVLSFERMAYRVIKESININKAQIDKSGKAMIVYDILNKYQKNLKFLGKSNENIDMILTQITEFKKHGITVTKLEEQTNNTEDLYLKSKLNDMLTIYKEFEKNILEFLDENDLLTILAENIKESKLFEESIFFIDEFAGFTKQEYFVIDKLNEIASEIYLTVCTDELRIKKSPEADIFYDNKQTVQTLCEMFDIDKDKQICLNNNYRFKNNELLHLEKNIFSIPYNIYRNSVNNIQLYLAENPYCEIEHIAKEIIKLVRNKGYRYRDITVICNNIGTYSSLCKAIFTEHDIPVFIDDKKDITQNILIKYILALLDIFSKNWSYDAMFNYLKTDFINVSNLYELENYCLKWGIQGKRFYQNEWNYEKGENKNNFNEDQTNIIKPLKEFENSLKQNKNAKNMSSAIYNFLINNNIKDKINNKENVEAWNLIIDVLNEITSIFKNKKVTFEEYSKLLKTGLANKELGQIPQTQDKVIVGDVNRTKTHKVKAVFIIGVNDGNFPSVNKNEGFFNDKDRDKLKNEKFTLAKGTKEKMYEENFNIYKAFSTAEEKVFVSYCASNSDGQPLRKSLMISRIKKIFPELNEISNEEDEVLTRKITFSKLLNNLQNEKWKEVYEWYKINESRKLEKALSGLKYTNVPENISKENIQKLYGKSLKTSVSKLETYRACPFSYFLKYGLKLSEKEKLDIKPIDTGTFMHDVIDQFFKYVNASDSDKNIQIEEVLNIEESSSKKNIIEADIKNEKLSIRNITEEQIEIIINKIVDEKLQTDGKFTLTAKYLTLVQRLKRILNLSIKYIVASLNESQFEIYGTEVEFGNKGTEKYEPIEIQLDDGKKVVITGKIDRIDIAKMSDGKYIRIIDYKSSTKDIDLNKFISGTQIQLITYVDAICKNENVMPAGAFYYTLLEPKIALNNREHINIGEIENQIKRNFRMNGIVLADLNIVKAMDLNLEKGESDKVPIKLNEDGNINYRSSSTVTRNEFEKLQKHAIKIIKQISNEILSGNIELKPFYNQKGKNTPCSYCQFKSICQFNAKFKNNNYRFIPNESKQDILDKLD